MIFDYRRKIPSPKISSGGKNHIQNRKIPSPKISSGGKNHIQNN